MMRPSAYERVPSHSTLTSAIELSELSEPPPSDPAAEPLQPVDVKDELGQVTELSTSRFERRFSGWRFGVAATSILMFSVLLINVAFTIWATSTHKSQGGIGTMYVGSCSQAETISTWLHLVINVLGTAMLSGSNYCKAP